MRTAIISSIRRATIGDTNRIWEFIKIAYKDTYEHMIPERWRWQYVFNPKRQHVNKVLPIWIAERDGRIVGQIAAIEVDFFIGGKRIKGGWGVDLIVLPECRGEGLGQRLIQEVVKECGFYIAVEMSMVTKRIYDRIGYIPLNPVTVYTKITRLNRTSIRDFILKLSNSRNWVRTLNRFLSTYPVCYSSLALLLNLFFRIKEQLSPMPKVNENIQIQETDDFGGWADDLLQDAMRNNVNMMIRDRSFLRWRFVNTPLLKYKIFMVYFRGKIAGYSVLRLSDPVEQEFGFIVDLLVPSHNQEVLEEIIRHSIEYFKSKTGCIQCSCPLKEYHAIFKKYGFIQMRKSIPYAYSTDNSLLSVIMETKEDWYITRGDSDWDQIYPVHIP